MQIRRKRTSISIRGIRRKRIPLGGIVRANEKDRKRGVKLLDGNGNPKPVVKCGVCDEERILFFVDGDEDLCYDCGHDRIKADMKKMIKAQKKTKRSK